MKISVDYLFFVVLHAEHSAAKSNREVAPDCATKEGFHFLSSIDG